MTWEMDSTIEGATTQFTDRPPFSVAIQGLDLTFLPAGSDRRYMMLKLIQEARHSLKLCFYIFTEDDISTLVRDALTDAARRGVSVTIILDRFGSQTSDKFLKPLRDAGATCRYFSERLSHRYLIRNHQKLIIADDEKAMFGGFNIQDDYFAPPQDNGWNDLAILMRGDAVEGLTDWFAKLDDWTRQPRSRFREIRRTVRQWSWQRGHWCWLVGGPTNGLSSWARMVSEDLKTGSRLDMLMAYFSPPKAILRRIGQIAQRGEVRLIMAGKSDNMATIGASRSLYRFLLAKDAKIWEFSPCKLHTKLLIIDDIVYFGSANFDMRSLYLNLELMFRIEDAALARQMREYIDQHIAASETITQEAHKRRATWWNRLRWNAGWLMVSLLDYTVSRRLNF